MLCCGCGNSKSINTNANTKPLNVSKTSEKDYKFEEEIAAGFHGDVWRALYLPNGTHKSCQIVERKHHTDDIEMIKSEFRNLSQLGHQCLVKFQELIETPTRLLIISEYCSGGNIYERFSHVKRMKEHHIRYIVIQILKCLHYLHKRGVPNCRLKPEHILFTHEKTYDLRLRIDFGFSKPNEAFNWLDAAQEAPLFVAPECTKNGNRLTNKADCWATGVLTFELVYGYPPFDEKEYLATMMTHEKISFGFEPITKPGKGNWFPKEVTVSSEIKTFIADLLKSDPNRRLSKSQALRHPWIKLGSHDDNEINTERLAHFMSGHKFLDIVEILAEELCDAHHSKPEAGRRSREEDPDTKQLKEDIRNQLRLSETHHWTCIDIRKILKKFDRNEDGVLEEIEFLDALENIDEDFDRKHAEKRLEGIAEADCRIEIEDFLRFYAYQYVHHQEHQLFDVIKGINPKRVGWVNKAEVEEYIQNHEHELNLVEGELELITNMLKDGDIPIVDFVTQLA